MAEKKKQVRPNSFSGTSCSFAEVKTPRPKNCNPFELEESEACFFDHIAQEHVQASGTELRLWHQDIEESIRDPLYDEPIDRVWAGPFVLRGWVEYMGGQPQMQEYGMTVRWSGNIWVARKELEDRNIPAPLEGDVIKFWDNKFFTEHSVNADEQALEGSPHPGYYFDVINVDDKGHVFDTGHFVGLLIQVQRRTEFTAERRLET